MRERTARDSLPGFLPEAAFAAVLDRAQWPLFSFVRGLVGEDEQARDLVQDACCDAWRAAQRLAPPFTEDGDEEEMRRWLFHAAYCRAISVRRRRRLLRWISLEAAGNESEEAVERPEAPRPFEDQVAEGEVVRAALARLSPEDAACLILNVVQGFPASEIAQIVGITSEAAKKRLSRAKERLRTAYFAQEREESQTQTSQPDAEKTPDRPRR